MWLFHLLRFSQNTYFVQVLATATASVFALQILALHSIGEPTTDTVWLRAAMVGAWSVSTAAAGMIGYQRFQGTLVHLVLSPMPIGRVLLPVVGSASLFGLAAFPLAAAGGAIARAPIHVGHVALLWVSSIAFVLACLAISTVIASLFVLTPNAMTYEALLVVPLVLLSGIFGQPHGPWAWLVPLMHALPTTPAVELLLRGDHMSPTRWALGLILTVLVSATWLAGASVLVRSASRRALVNATLEVI